MPNSPIFFGDTLGCYKHWGIYLGCQKGVCVCVEFPTDLFSVKSMSSHISLRGIVHVCHRAINENLNHVCFSKIIITLL